MVKLLNNKVKVSVGDAEKLVTKKKRARTRSKSKKNLQKEVGLFFIISKNIPTSICCVN